jgi:hypothetical protein
MIEKIHRMRINRKKKNIIGSNSKMGILLFWEQKWQLSQNSIQRMCIRPLIKPLSM